MVMCSEPVMRTPAKGFSAAYLRRMDIRPGISCSAIEISLRPQSARERSATLKAGTAEVRSIVAGVMYLNPHIDTSEYVDTIRKNSHDVNRKSSTGPGRHKSPAHVVTLGTGGALGGRAAGDPRYGPEFHFHTLGAVETFRCGGGQAVAEECFVL